jgi:hypothetical protein
MVNDSGKNTIGKLLYSNVISNLAAIANTPGVGAPWVVPFTRSELDNNAPWTNVFITNNSAQDIKIIIPKKQYKTAEYLIYAGERILVSFDQQGDPLVYQLDVENQGAVDIAIGEITINYNNFSPNMEKFARMD